MAKRPKSTEEIMADLRERAAAVIAKRDAETMAGLMRASQAADEGRGTDLTDLSEEDRIAALIWGEPGLSEDLRFLIWAYETGERVDLTGMSRDRMIEAMFGPRKEKGGE